MRNRRPTYGLVALFALGMLFAQVPAQNTISALRPKLFDTNQRDPLSAVTSIKGPTPVLIAALGGFRTVAADLLWLKVDQLWDGGAWYLLPSVMESVVELDPHFLKAWEVYGWHLAYNLNAESVLELDKRYWLDQGLQVLHRAVDANPDSAEMTQELAWAYFDRAHQMDKAAEYFYRTSEMPGSKSFSARLYYRAYEHELNLKKLWPALKYAMGKFPDDHPHQYLVHRDWDFWQTHWNDPFTHRRIMVEENTARQQRALPFNLYPDDPFWNVCPICGMPTKKGEPECSVCHGYRFAPEQPGRGPGARAQGPEAGV